MGKFEFYQDCKVTSWERAVSYTQLTAEAKGYLGVVALGDASIQAAAKEAGITRIHHVDYQAKSYVGVYNVYTVIVYGE